MIQPPPQRIKQLVQTPEKVNCAIVPIDCNQVFEHYNREEKSNKEKENQSKINRILNEMSNTLDSITETSLSLVKRVDSVESRIIKLDMRNQCNSSIKETKEHLFSKDNDISTQESKKTRFELDVSNHTSNIDELEENNTILEEKMKIREAEVTEHTEMLNMCEKDRKHVKKSDITELKALSNPPQPIQTLMEQVFRVVGQPTFQWSYMKSRDILRDMLKVDVSKITWAFAKDMVGKVRALQHIVKVSAPAQGVQKWLNAVVSMANAMYELANASEKLALLIKESLDITAQIEKEKKSLAQALKKLEYVEIVLTMDKEQADAMQQVINNNIDCIQTINNRI